MASSNVLKEFLVSIGFKIDEQQYRNFQEALRTTGKNALELGKSTALASTVLGASLRTVSAQLETLYYASQRTGASAKELKEFSFAASQIGVSAERAQDAIEGLAAARRTNPGLNGMLANMGIDPRQTDNARVMVELLAKLHSVPHYQGAQIAQMFGLDEQTFNMLELGLPQMQKYLALREKMFAAAGIDPGQMAAKAHEFQTQLRTFEAAFGNLVDIVEYRMMPAGERVIDWLEEIVGWLDEADKSTDGWSSKLLAVASALGGLGILKGGFGMLGNMLGGGGAAAAGEEAAAGAAGLAIPEVLIAAVCAAALAWVATHPQEVGKAVAAIGKAAEWEAKHLPEQITHLSEAAARAELKLEDAAKHPLITAAKIGAKLAPWFENFEQGMTVGDLPDDFLDKIKKSEGFRSRKYWDHGGWSIGYGHQIKKGEEYLLNRDINEEFARGFLLKDVGSALAEVKKTVHRPLNKGQMEALTDFVYNLGSGNFESSTLLKDVNAGDFDGAADQFQYWNKVLENGHYVANEGLSARRASEAALFRGTGQPVTITQKTDIHVNDSGTGTAVARQQDRVNGDLVRNMVGATR